MKFPDNIQQERLLRRDLCILNQNGFYIMGQRIPTLVLQFRNRILVTLAIGIFADSHHLLQQPDIVFQES